MEDDLMYSIFGEFYEDNCVCQGWKVDFFIIEFKKWLYQVINEQYSFKDVIYFRIYICNEINDKLFDENWRIIV